MPKQISLLGVKIDLGVDLQTVLEKIVHFLRDDNCHYICTTNPEFIMAATEDIHFRELINGADLSLPDGIGISFAAWFQELARTKSFLQAKFYKRITGVDLVHALCNLASKRGYTVFLLGGWPKDFFGKPKNVRYDLAEVAAQKLCHLYPNLRVVGASSAFSFKKFDDESSRQFIADCMKREGLSHIDLLFVAYGMAKQESWIVRNAYKIPAKISVGVGGTFDYLADVQRRPPYVLRLLGLEWLCRMFLQPWRLRRILQAFPAFPLKVISSTLKNSFKNY